MDRMSELAELLKRKPDLTNVVVLPVRIKKDRHETEINNKPCSDK